MVLFGKRTFAATAGELLVVGTGEAPELRCFSPEGALVRIVRWPDTDRAVTPQRVERFFEAGLAQMPEAQRGAARALAENMPRADVAPALEDIIGSAEGEVWVGEYPGPEMVIPGARMPERQWLVFAPEGELRATLRTPTGFRLHFVRGDMLLGVHTDELGVESVRAYRMGRD